MLRMTRPREPNSDTHLRISGYISIHGLHHVAQKSSRTTFPFSDASDSGFPSHVVTWSDGAGWPTSFAASISSVSAPLPIGSPVVIASRVVGVRGAGSIAPYAAVDAATTRTESQVFISREPFLILC